MAAAENAFQAGTPIDAASTYESSDESVTKQSRGRRRVSRTRLRGFGPRAHQDLEEFGQTLQRRSRRRQPHLAAFEVLALRLIGVIGTTRCDHGIGRPAWTAVNGRW